jgi:hypothetical protein
MNMATEKDKDKDWDKDTDKVKDRTGTRKRTRKKTRTGTRTRTGTWTRTRTRRRTSTRTDKDMDKDMDTDKDKDKTCDEREKQVMKERFSVKRSRFRVFIVSMIYFNLRKRHNFTRQCSFYLRKRQNESSAKSRIRLDAIHMR